MTESAKSHEAILTALDALLEEERKALLQGDLDMIGVLLEHKATLISELDDASPDEADAIRPVQLKLRRNQDLFDQALAGIRNVANRLGEMRQVRRSIDVYDAKGHRSSIGGDGTGSFEKRA
ncbi:flagellar protein FlgN [Salipiger sp. 1_MG-2023]|uniref:flagellar protein FlgN n=1 Tax=Salipiger sp. 1_MG-2023 TaxID=3062665 RepID=UPI0026E435B1|nr:flagellar protein FlgN [Salipiger sp. 1_MG-2023]MDO6586260.1 flagellar protein FlgN [Salipiger sp. 1_MG-2023]